MLLKGDSGDGLPGHARFPSTADDVVSERNVQRGEAQKVEVADCRETSEPRPFPQWGLPQQHAGPLLAPK